MDDLTKKEVAMRNVANDLIKRARIIWPKRGQHRTIYVGDVDAVVQTSRQLAEMVLDYLDYLDLSGIEADDELPF